MENLTIEGTAKTPTVDFNASTGVLELKGRSIPENSIEFYKPLNEWVEAYGSSSQGNTQVNMKLEYFNTSSSKCILDFFKKLEGISSKTAITVNWHFEEDDEDMQEAGEDYGAILSLTFKMIEVEEI